MSLSSAWVPWSRYDEAGLARYVTTEGSGGLNLKLDRLEAAATPEGRLQIAQAIYEALLTRQVRYTHERYHPSAVLQPIRAPAEIFEEHEGTCLDLAALFCGVSLHFELLPILIILDGHALAAIDISAGLPDWNAPRPGRALFDNGPLKDGAALQELIQQKLLVPIECTGFARTAGAGENSNSAFPETVGRENGVMTFKRAQAAGMEQIDSSRALVCAVDVAVAHYAWRVSPVPVTPVFQSFRKASMGVACHIQVQDFEALVNDLTRYFVGRRAVFQKLDEHLANGSFLNGYVVIQGEPGSGKSAIMSRLVQQRGYVHHFNIAPQNIRSTRLFLENICAQLIVRYGLKHSALPRGAGSTSGPLVTLLLEALRKNPGTAIVILVDALDESEAAGDGMNRLDLPKALPDGAFIVVSTREQMDYQLVVNRRRDINLADFSRQTNDDVHEYISLFIAREPQKMRARFRDWGLDETRFTAELAERSGGNFMYLVYVLDDIATGRLGKDTIDSIQQLPGTLREYYQRHWRLMRERNRSRYEKLYEPVVCVLAAVHEPVSIAYVAEMTRLDTRQVREVIGEWRQFLRESPMPGGKPLFRIYHKSFQDFLLEEVGLEPYQRMITRTAVSKIPGLQL